MTCVQPTWLPEGVPSWLRPDFQCSDWGTVPEWVAAVGTVLALLLGVLVFRRELDQRWAEKERELAAEAAQVQLWSRVGRDKWVPMTEDVRLLEADDPDMLLLHDFELGRHLQPVEIALSNGSASPVTRLLVATQKSFMEPLGLSLVEAIRWWWASVETRLRDPRIEWIARPWVVQIPLLEPGETKRFRVLTHDPDADLQVVFYMFRSPLPWVFNEDVGLLDHALSLRAMPVARCKFIWLARRPRKDQQQEPTTPSKDQTEEVDYSG